MPRDHEGQCDCPMKPGQHAPQQVSYHDVIFVLTPAVVRMEVDVQLAKPMYFEEMVQHTDDGIGPFTNVNSFVNQVIDLTW